MIIAFTGAGISKESGIDTFQDKPGIRDKLTRQFAKTHPAKYREVIREFVEATRDKEPNDAHYALAQYKIPVITMNVDTLHEQAGSTELIKVHGRLPADEEELRVCDQLVGVPVLYGDPAPKYQDAIDLVEKMRSGDILLVVGASNATAFAYQLKTFAWIAGARVVEIQDNASTKVRKFLEKEFK